MSKASKVIRLFCNNDLMSIFLNLEKLVDFSKDKAIIKVIYKKKDQREITIFIPKKEQKKDIQRYLKTKDDKIMIAMINQKIFSSKNGELLLSLDKNGICHRAILKDVLMFGDIKAELISYKIKD